MRRTVELIQCDVCDRQIDNCLDLGDKELELSFNRTPSETAKVLELKVLATPDFCSRECLIRFFTKCEIKAIV